MISVLLTGWSEYLQRSILDVLFPSEVCDGAMELFFFSLKRDCMESTVLLISTVGVILTVNQLRNWVPFVAGDGTEVKVRAW